MRFEGKHKQFKNAARATSFKNILKTLTVHHQRLMAFTLHFDSLFESVTVSSGAGVIAISEAPHYNYSELVSSSYLF